MRKIKFIFIIVVFSIFITGCKVKKAEITQEAIEEIETLMKSYENVKGDVVLPQKIKCLENATLTWTSSDPDILSNEGKLTHKTVSYKKITLTLVIKLEDATKELVFYPVVQSLSTEDALLNIINSISSSLKEVTNVSKEKIPENSEFNIEEVLNEGEESAVTYNKELSVLNVKRMARKTSLKFTLVYRGVKHEIVKKFSLPALDADYYKGLFNTWVYEKLNRGEVKEDLNFENEYLGLDVIWQSTDQSVITNDGKVTRYPFPRHVLIWVLATNNNNISFRFSERVYVEPLSYDTKEEKLDAFVKYWENQKTIKMLKISGYNDLQNSFNHLWFTVNKKPEITRIMSTNPNNVTNILFGSNRPLQFIVVHDTANTRRGAGARNHLNYMNNPQVEVGFHFCVDQKEIGQGIETTMITWHAGDGRREFGLTDTGVKANSRFPKITIDKATGYYYFNGMKTNVLAPKKDAMIATNGIYSEIGSNGNWYINNTYYNKTYKRIANHGGNNNGIGIETCVDEGSSYIKTLNNLRMLLVKLITENNLEIKNVLMHNNFSGKHCGRAIIDSALWMKVLDITESELYVQRNFSDLTFTWKSNSTNLESDGNITTKVINQEVLKYTLVITGAINKTYNFETKVLKI